MTEYKMIFPRISTSSLPCWFLLLSDGFFYQFLSPCLISYEALRTIYQYLLGSFPREPIGHQLHLVPVHPLSPAVLGEIRLCDQWPPHKTILEALDLRILAYG